MSTQDSLHLPSDRPGRLLTLRSSRDFVTIINHPRFPLFWGKTPRKGPFPPCHCELNCPSAADTERPSPEGLAHTPKQPYLQTAESLPEAQTVPINVRVCNLLSL